MGNRAAADCSQESIVRRGRVAIVRLNELSLAHIGDIGRRGWSGFAGRRDQIAGPLERTVPETTQVVGIGGSLLWDLLRTRDGQERPPSRHMGSSVASDSVLCSR
jgi:hypothetical protein